MRSSRHLGAFASLFAFVALLRFSTLLRAQTHVNADEAIIGLMARHVAEGLQWPVYFYGQAYNGGAALEAYLTAPGFALFGSSVIALKGVIVVLSLATLALFYAFVNRFWDRRVAWIASALFALSPTLTMWHYQVRGGYGEYLLLVVAQLYAAFVIADRTRARPVHYALFGFVGGLGLWCFEITLATFAPLAAWLLWRRPSPLADRRTGLTVAGLLIGYAPSLVYNLRTGGRNWRTLVEGKLSGGANAGALLEPDTLWRLISWELPRFFGPDTVLWYLEDWHVSGALFYAAAVCAIALALWRLHLRRLETGARALGRGVEIPDAREAVLLLLVVCCAIPYAIVVNRLSPYLLGVIPLLSIVGATQLAAGLQSVRRPVRATSAVVLVALCGAGLWEAGRYAAQDQVELLRVGASGKLEHALYDGSNTTDVIAYLEKRDIEYVWATASLAYPIAFESEERVIASSKIFPWAYAVVPGYDRWVQRASRSWPVFVLHRESAYLKTMTETFAQKMRGPYTRTPIGELVVLEPAGMSRPDSK